VRVHVSFWPINDDCRLRLYAEESLEEMQSSKSELEMLDMAVQFEAMRNQNNQSDARMTHANRTVRHNGVQERPQQPLQLTQITQDPMSGQLQFSKQQISNGTLQNIGLPSSSLSGTQIQRQQIAEGVFNPSWNLPTMSLDELAEKERADAIARSKSQKEAEARAKTMPRRYEQLVKDGMEDDADLVDKSAALDRKWDEWKEENPRGSGNKMSERGDRNF
jgi:immunoglobulin-binding protein 1